MEFSQLQAFVSVAQNHSFSITANELHLTQPAISRRISTLEGYLDCKLFDRIGHRIQLTEAGKRLLPKALNILQELEDCKKYIQNIEQSISGQLTFAASHHIGLHRLPETLKTYKKQFNDVELDFHFLDSELACAAVQTGKIELAVITLPLIKDKNLLMKPLWQDHLYCMVNNDHQLNKMASVTIEDLVTVPMLLPKVQTYTSQIIERPFIERNLVLNTIMQTNELENIRMLVEIGFGWSVLPETMLREPLVIIPVKDLTLKRTLGYVRHKDRTLSNAAKAMIKMLESTRDL